MILISISQHTSSFSRAPFASPQRKASGSVDDSEEKEMAIALKEALEATICMVSFLVSKELGKRRNKKFYHTVYLSDITFNQQYIFSLSAFVPKVTNRHFHNGVRK